MNYFLKFNFFSLYKKVIVKVYEDKPILKLSEHQELIIKSFYKGNKKFEETFIIVDDKNNKYWCNKSLNDYVIVHK